jgi:F0F1-type ATP synthase assembly protein I
MADSVVETIGPRGFSPKIANREEHLALLFKLKRFAICQGYDLDNGLIDEIVPLEIKYPEEKIAANSDDLIKVDRLIVQLSRTTYPVNISNVDAALESNGITAFVYALMSLGCGAVLLAGFLIWTIANKFAAEAAGAGLALSLGFVGAIVYVMLPNGKLNLFAGIDAANRANTIVRVVMGGILGFVLSALVMPITSAVDPKQLLIPLVGGYSMTLVVGILAKAVAAVELTFNIDEKAVRASLRK